MNFNLNYHQKCKDFKVWINQVFDNTGHAVRLISAKLKWKMKEMERKKCSKLERIIKNVFDLR